MKYKSEIYGAIHQDAVEMFKVGAISEDRMKEYDEKCIVQEPETAQVNRKTIVTGHARTRVN